MLKSTALLAQKLGIECFVSLERMMACGVGICQSCAVELKGKDKKDDTFYKLCCTDGPVFDAKMVVW